MSTSRRSFLAVAANLVAAPVFAFLAEPAVAQAEQVVEPWAEKLIKSGETQIGETVLYDPAYVQLAYPGGDVPRDRGVCTDVIVRAYRDAFGIDLQKLVHEDMRSAFTAYPRTWGLKQPDRNIDHRRVPNLETFFARQGASLAVSANAGDYRAGDLVSQRLPAGQPHIGIVSAKANQAGTRPLMIHNIGAGARAEDVLFTFEIVGHYRFKPA